MNFEEANKSLKEGHKIRRKAWEPSMFLHGSKCYRQECIPFNYTFDIIDSDEWYVLGGYDPDTYTFPETIKLLLAGRKLAQPNWPNDSYIECSMDKKDIFLRQTCEYGFCPTFECLAANDWLIIDG